ncbi:unnamed protein product [Symbiodinium microadriaticum]|nr:unnamed protein product [Symbiodinium microadriaticum]
MGNSSPRPPPELDSSTSEPSFKDLETHCRKLNPQQRSALLGLLGTAIGDAVGLPFELHAHAKNRERFAIQQGESGESAAARFWSDVMPFLSSRLSPAEGTSFCRSYSDDTVCTDLKMHAIAKVVWTCGAMKVPENRLFEALMQEFLAWAHGSGGQLFQGYGGFTKDLLKPSRGNRLGHLKIELFQPDSDYWPTEDFLKFAQEHCSGNYPGGFPSFGNGAVMSMTPQVLFQMAGAGPAAQVLCCTHSEASAMLAADLLSELLRGIHEKKLKSGKDIGRFVLKSTAWKQSAARLNQLQDGYVYPCAAFREFLESGDCKADTANSFLHTLITKSNLPPSESELVTHPGPFGYFGEMLRIAANFDDDAVRQGTRLVVEGRPDVLVRFSQRGMNTTIMAIWCAAGAKTCVGWLQRMLYVGGDTDTIGAVAGQIACPLLEPDDVMRSFQQGVALDGLHGQAVAVAHAAARRFFYRSLLFVRASWSQLLQTPRLVDAKYDGLTTPDGMRLAGHRRTSCRYGGKCYDRKRQHRSQYSHPGDEDWQRLPCRYQSHCRNRADTGHLLEFSHPGDHDWEVGEAAKSDSDDDEDEITRKDREMTKRRLRELGQPATFFAETDAQRFRRLQGCELSRDQDVLADGSTNVMQILDRRQQREREAAGGIRQGVDIVDAEDAEFATQEGTVTRHEPNDNDSDSEDDGPKLAVVLGSEPDERDKEQEEAQRKLDAASHAVMTWIRSMLRAWEAQLTERAAAEPERAGWLLHLVEDMCHGHVQNMGFMRCTGTASLILIVGLNLPSCLADQLLQPISTDTPNSELFPHVSGHVLKPVNTGVHGPKSTNKFWANWIVSDPMTGDGAMHAIYPMPYALKLGDRHELKASHNRQPRVWYQDGMLKNRDSSRIELYQTSFVGEFALGASELVGVSSSFEIGQEGLFGVHVNVKQADGETVVMYPIYSGMAYVSGRYYGATPHVTTERINFGVVRPFNHLHKVRDGVWSVTTGHHHLTNTPAEIRLYALTEDLDFVDSSFELNIACQGYCISMNKQLNGWMRGAHVLESNDADVLDAHAPTILVGWDLKVEPGGVVRYKFETARPKSGQLLHWAYAHHVKMLQPDGNAKVADTLSASQAPTKGLMQGVVGNVWVMKAPLYNATSRLDFLPHTDFTELRRGLLVNETRASLRWFSQPLHETNLADPPNWRHSMFKSDFYFSGKGFQKVAMICLLAEELLTQQEMETCASWLGTGFECILSRSKGESTSSDCAGAPGGLYYDEVWGGLPSRVGYNQASNANPVLHCLLADFGNSCYNDHHYHFGYFVVAAAVLVKLQPEWKDNSGFVDFVSGLIRDTSNPSRDDLFFPRFRSFDWFDLHSWSRGLAPNPDGKDEESTSEELNLHYGIYLWGREMGNENLQQLGATMLALATTTVQEFFLMGKNNPHHPQDYARNRAPGMLLQNKAQYATYFGNKFEYIHGIQMIPLSPALLLARTPTFSQLEWSEILCHLPLSPADPWTPVLLTGGLAMFDPNKALELLLQVRQESMDDGLTRAWALYWTSAQPQHHETWSCGKPPQHTPRACPTGHYRDGAQCIQCPPGTWNDLRNQTGFRACKQCGAGRYSSQAGLTSSDSCTPCPAGTWSVAVGAQLPGVCIPCSRDPKAHPSCSTESGEISEGSHIPATMEEETTTPPKAVMIGSPMSAASRYSSPRRAEKQQTFKLEKAQYRQSKQYLKPLRRALRDGEVDAGVTFSLAEIAEQCGNRSYRAAKEAYMRLAIGNHPWPMGVTFVTFHDRANRHKIGEGAQAHVLDDETTRKYVQMVKRLVTFAEAVRH